MYVVGMNDRVRQLEAFAKEDPTDPFNLYALALEYLKMEPARALVLFEQLVVDHPRYLPTYYPFAHLLIDLQEYARAEQIFAAGVEVARHAQDAKAMRELNNAWSDFKFNLE